MLDLSFAVLPERLCDMIVFLHHLDVPVWVMSIQL